MIDGRDIWNCVKSIFAVLAVITIGIGISIGIILNLPLENTTTNNDVIGHLVDNTPRHSIPKNTEIVAACTDSCGVFAYIVKDAKGNHYYVELVSREVRRIEYVDVVGESKTIVNQETIELPTVQHK